MKRSLGFFRKILGFYKDIKRYASILNAKSIARRMFVTNSFDGLLSSLGVIFGGYLSGLNAPSSYVGGVVGASFAMGFFSGFVATYLSERAERLRELKETERAMLHPLRGTIYERAARLVPIYVAFWSGLGAILLPVIGVAPFIVDVVLRLKLSIVMLVYSSVTIILLELFLLGVYLGRISGENIWLNGAKLSGIGLAAALFFTLLSLLF